MKQDGFWDALQPQNVSVHVAQHTKPCLRREFYPGRTPLGGSLYNGPVSIRGVPPAGPGHRDAAEPLPRVPWAAGPRTAGLGAKWGITIKITESRTSDQETLTSRSPAGEPHGPPEGAGSGQAERGVHLHLPPRCSTEGPGQPAHVPHAPGHGGELAEGRPRKVSRVRWDASCPPPRQDRPR